MLTASGAAAFPRIVPVDESDEVPLVRYFAFGTLESSEGEAQSLQQRIQRLMANRGLATAYADMAPTLKVVQEIESL